MLSAKSTPTSEFHVLEGTKCIFKDREGLHSQLPRSVVPSLCLISVFVLQNIGRARKASPRNPPRAAHGLRRWMIQLFKLPSGCKLPWTLDESAAEAPLGLHIALGAGGSRNQPASHPSGCKLPWALDESAAEAPLGLHIALGAGGSRNQPASHPSGCKTP